MQIWSKSCARHFVKSLIPSGVFLSACLLLYSTLTENSRTLEAWSVDNTSHVVLRTPGRGSDGAILKTSGRQCDPNTEYEGIKQKYSTSQDKEDIFLLDTYFNGLCEGSYLELGALDGIKISNTHLFHRGLDWAGVLIEPNPVSYKALEKNRPKDELFNVAVCADKRKVHFASGSPEVTGVYEFMSESFRNRWHPKSEVSKMPTISCGPLGSLLEASSTGKKHIDFFSLDVEGAEYEVLRTVNFSTFQFGVIFYEADGHNTIKDEAVKSLLEVNGYPFRLHAMRSNFHSNEFWHEIYAEFV